MGDTERDDEEWLDVVIIDGEPMRVMISIEAKARLQAECDEKDVALSDVIREAISRLVEQGGRP